MGGGQNEEAQQLHDFPIRFVRLYHKKHKMICSNCKRRLCKANEDTKGSPSIMDLPDLVLVNILSRLPIKSIFHSKCVCKVWYDLISDRYFSEAYLANSPFVSTLLSLNGVLSNLVEVRAEYNYSISPSEPIYSGNKFNLLKGLENKFMLIGSCNGLLCLWNEYGYKDDHSLYVCNPIFREWVAIPKPSGKRVRRFTFGFGCSAATGQFKILRIAKKLYNRQPLKSEAEIFTIGVDKSWRDVGACPFPERSRICGVTLNGALHWIEEINRTRDARLFSFNLAEEKVQQLPTPHGLIGTFYTTVGVLGNCLCIFDNNWHQQLDLWWMKDYGVGESWTRDQILRSSIGITVNVTRVLLPITIWRDGEILMVWYKGAMFSYDPKRKKLTQVKVSFMEDFSCEAIPYVPSFSSLKDVMGENVKMIDMKSIS